MFKFFKKNIQNQKEKQGVSFEIELTAAVLAYEIARSDGDITNDEVSILMEEIKKIAKKVNKDPKEILKIVESYSDDSVSFYEFIQDINSNYLKNEKLELLKVLWKTAYADGKLDVDEEKLVRRVADLINVKDVEVLKLKDISKKSSSQN